LRKERPNSQPFDIFVVPHSHIDVEWTWDYPETIRKVNAIFGSAFALLKRDPDYRFAQDQVPCIEPFLARLTGEDRELFLSMCREGRFEIIGGMYVQPEVAEPHGECLVRNIIYGRKWFEENLGVTDIPVVWNADTFGQASQLAQICAKAGFTYFCFSRGVDLLAGDQLASDFRQDGAPDARWRKNMPSDFWWMSPDGTKIQTHWMPSGYPARVGGTEPEEVAETIKEIAAHATTRSLLFPWGQDCYDPGDEDSDFILSRFRAELFGFRVRTIKLSSVREYLESVAAQGELPELTHEMVECDLRGTFENRCRLKQANRQAEQLLLAAEKLSTLCAALGMGYPTGGMADLWEKLLFNQFHDTIGGSHIDAVYVKAMARYDAVIDGADSLVQEGLQALGSRVDLQSADHPIVVFNPLSQPGTGMCAAEVRFSPREEVRSVVLKDADGEAVPIESIERVEGRSGEWRSARVQFVARDIPATGYSCYEVVPNVRDQQAPMAPLRVGENWIESPTCRVTVDPATGLVSIFDLRRNRLVVRDGNELVADQEIEPNMEGHSIRFSGVSFRSRDWGPEKIEVEVPGRTAVIRVIGPYKDCRRVQEARLYADLPIVEFRTRLEDFSGGDVMIKARFPICPDECGEVLYETPFAVTSRPAGHYCAQTWAAIQNPAGGVAIVNRGTAGYYADGGTLDLVLLRSAADYRGYHAHLANEHGTHTFEYALCSYQGQWEDSRLIELAHAYNAPLCAREVVAERAELPRRKSLLQTEGDGIEWVAVKQAMSGEGVVLRGYETRGRSTTARVKLPWPCKEAWLADLIERPAKRLRVTRGEVSYDCGPWEVFTLLASPP